VSGFIDDHLLDPSAGVPLAEGILFIDRFQAMTDRKTSRLYRDVEVVNDLGIHARSAARIAEIASGASAGIWLNRQGLRADATSIMDMLTLFCPQGTRLTIEIEVPADLPVLAAIEELFIQGFGE
jgi:phosphocarrier protein HPr